MAAGRMTRRNPNTGTYRIPGNEVGKFRMEYQREMTVIFGDIADRLGQYEDIGTPEEIRALVKKYKKTG